jgi:hypothetical protein
MIVSVSVIVPISISLFAYGEDNNIKKGLEIYTPTKLEWASMELNVLHGKNTMTHESPVQITFMPKPKSSDTILCLIQYTNDVMASVLKINRDSIVEVFNIYKNGQGWPWLKLEITEIPMKQRWPTNQ